MDNEDDDDDDDEVLLSDFFYQNEAMIETVFDRIVRTCDTDRGGKAGRPGGHGHEVKWARAKLARVKLAHVIQIGL